MKMSGNAKRALISHLDDVRRYGRIVHYGPQTELTLWAPPLRRLYRHCVQCRSLIRRYAPRYKLGALDYTIRTLTTEHGSCHNCTRLSESKLTPLQTAYLLLTCYVEQPRHHRAV